MSRKSKKKDRVAASEGSCAPGAQGTTPLAQSPRRSLAGRSAGLVALLLAAVFAVWTGWHFLHRRGQSAAGDKGNPAATAYSAPTGIHAIRNVVLVSIDTCRADHLSCYGYKRLTTPNIDAVARDGAMFKMALTPVPVTTPAHSSMLTGTYPPTHGVHLNSYGHLANSNVTLAKTLREAGYQTAAFVGAFPLDPRFGLNQGFDTYNGSFCDESKKRRGAAAQATRSTARPWPGWTATLSSPSFSSFIITISISPTNRTHPI